jgi:trimethylamine--corrinoid protein Co-methyltransferase
MTPRIAVLSDSDLEKIIDGAFTILEKVGIHIGHSRVLNMLGSKEGVRIDGNRAKFKCDLIETCIKMAPSEIHLFYQDRDEPLVLARDEVNFVAGSVSPYVYDPGQKVLREATSKDLVEHIKILNHCEYIDFQSGAYVVSDVPKPITSSYRYYLSLLYSPKPMFGGAFGTKDIHVIKEMLVVLAGGEKALQERPITVVPTNPSSPLGITEVVAENISFCAEHHIPIMLVPIPLTGGSSPVTLAGTLVQHTAENLGALVVAQCIRQGAQVIFGGGPSIMDMRRGTACMASTESVLMGISISQIAKKLNLPCATNTGCADSKRVDYQAGEESGIALTLMALAGINMIRGAGEMEYKSVVSKEKLLLDNEVCGMARRMLRSIETSEEALAIDLILDRASSSDGFLSAPHTLKYFKAESFSPSGLIDRGYRREFEEQGCKDAFERTAAKITKILKEYKPREFDTGKKKEMDRIILSHARQYGMDKLPVMGIN